MHPDRPMRAERITRYLSGPLVPKGGLDEDDGLEDDVRESIRQALQVPIGVYGYERSSEKVALGAFVDARYQE